MPWDPAALQRAPSLTWVGHATLCVRLGGGSFLTDPMYSQRASPLSFAGPGRLVPPGVPLPALPPLDCVLLSHDHYDHADLPTLRLLAQRGVPMIVPAGLGDLVREAGGRATELEWWQHTEVEKLRVHCVPARHFSGRGLRDRNRRLWCGWVVEDARRRFYFAGDTAYFDGFAEIGKRLGPIDLAAIPIGAYLPRVMMGPVHLDPEQAVQAALDLETRLAFGMHWGTFDLADEPPEEPPVRFLAEARRRGLGERAFVLAVGQTRPF